MLVLEAGRESHPWSRIPVGFAKLIATVKDAEAAYKRELQAAHDALISRPNERVEERQKHKR